MYVLYISVYAYAGEKDGGVLVELVRPVSVIMSQLPVILLFLQ